MNPINLHAGVGAGKRRNPWKIRECLSAEGLTMADVARAIGVDHSVVAKTVSGQANSRRVLAWLLEWGVSAEHLSLPRDMA